MTTQRPVTHGEPRSRQHWSPPPLIRAAWLRWLIIALVLGYLVVAVGSVDVNWARIVRGIGRSASLLSGFLTPDFVTRHREIVNGVLESLTMAVVSTAIGVALAVPVGLGAASNIAPRPVYLLCRGFITISRSFQEVIIALIFVVMVGFGPMAGMLTLTFASIGFVGKLLAESIEAIDGRQLEAVRATGAGTIQVISYAVMPQILPRYAGLAIYRLDINFRESSVIGIVGAGGIGTTLNTAFSRYDFPIASAVLIVIVVLVLLAEYASGIIRRRLN